MTKKGMSSHYCVSPLLTVSSSRNLTLIRRGLIASPETSSIPFWTMSSYFAHFQKVENQSEKFYILRGKAQSSRRDSVRRMPPESYILLFNYKYPYNIQNGIL